jgi:hypothetical protein
MLPGIPKAYGLAGSPARVGFGVEIEQQTLAPETRKGNLVSILIGK